MNTTILLILVLVAIAIWATVFLTRKLKTSTIRLNQDPRHIIEKLSEVQNETNLVQRLYPQIAKNAGRELVPSGVVLMLILSVNDFASNYPPMMYGVLLANIPGWIKALVEDDVMCQLTLDHYQKTIQKAKPKPPKIVKSKGTVEEYKLFCAVKRVAETFFEEVERVNDPHLRVHKVNDSVNPFYDQTESGIFLEYYYSSPHKLWTPWGSYQFSGSLSYSGDPWSKILPRFLKRVGAEIYEPEKNLSYGTVGPVYALHSLDDKPLPQPKLRPAGTKISYDNAKEVWAKFEAKYRSSKTSEPSKLA